MILLYFTFNVLRKFLRLVQSRTSALVVVILNESPSSLADVLSLFVLLQDDDDVDDDMTIREVRRGQ